MFDNNWSRITSNLDNKEKEVEDFYRNFYRAYVIKNQDPEGRGKIQVRIPAFHGLSQKDQPFFTDNQLPWAEPGLMFCAANNSGTLMVPEMGSVVWVGFEYQSNNLVYFGGIYNAKPEKSRVMRYPRNTFRGQDKVITTSDALDESITSANKVIYKSPKGAIIMVGEADGREEVIIRDSSGQIFNLVSTDSDNKKAYILLQHNEKDYIKISDSQININAEKVYINGKEVK